MKSDSKKKAGKGTKGYKKYLIIFIGVVILAGAGYVALLKMTNNLLMRTPVMVFQNPHVTFFVGKVQYRESENSKWVDVEIGDKLLEGYEVKTEKNSYVDIGFHENTAIRVMENTVIKMNNLNIKKMGLGIKSGSVYGKFSKLFKDHEIEIETPTMVAAVRGTELGFEVGEVKPEVKGKVKGKKSKEKEETPADVPPRIYSRIYALTGITEISKPMHDDERILIAYQQQLEIKEGESLSEPQPMEKLDITKMKETINLIHEDEVFLISNKILFKSGSAEILPNSNAELDRILVLLKKKDLKIRIEGHTDNISTQVYNYGLSNKRANAIKDYFVSKGIKPDRLSVKGYGQSRPVANNATEAGRELNRRVEFIVEK